MTEPLQVGQFAIVDHEPVDRGPNAGVFHGKGPADDRAELFILAEGTTPAGEAFAGHVVSAIGQAFTGLDMSLTGSLRRLFADAERNLSDWNRKSIAQHRVSIGLSCFGRRGDQAVIAQGGPSVAFHYHGGGVTPYFAGEEHGRPIGAAHAEPLLTRIPFAPGDRLLMISTPALAELDDELIGGILGLPADQILPDLYRRVQHLRNLTVLLVTGPGQAPAQSVGQAAESDVLIDATTPAGPPQAVRQPDDASTYQPSLFIEDERGEDIVFTARRQLLEISPRRQMEQIVPEAVEAAPAPLLRASGEPTATLARIAADTHARAAVSRAAVGSLATAMPSAPLANRPVWRAPSAAAPTNSPLNAGGPGDSRRLRRESFTRGLVPPGAPPTRPDLLNEDLPLVDDLAAGRRAKVSTTPAAETIASEAGAAMNSGGSLVRMRDSAGGRWKSSHTFNRHATGAQLPPTWLVIAIGLGILLLLVGIVTVPRMLEGDDAERYVELVDNAAQRLATARVVPDPAEKRIALNEAQAMLLQARELDSSNEQAEQLFNEVAGALQVMDHVIEPANVEVIATVEQFGEKAVAVVRMTIGTDLAFVLDTNSSQVLALPLVGGDPRVVYTEDKAQQRGRPVAIAYLDASDLGGPVLLVADSLNHLWAYSDDGGLRAVAFNAGSGLTITDIAVNGRDLFVLDAAQKTVLRYTQNETGFPNPPAKALATDDLANARRLMVDTEIITSDEQGTLHRFINDQVALTLSQSGIDKPLVAPETAQVLSKNEIGLLDAPNDRIVVFRRDGAFDRQYRHKDFRAASAFAVRDGEVYIFSDARLRKITW
ncbi:MAG: serine/threonine-protein phosphatase [Chloroflexi bacterium]|nr:serine/threonine-protein phosphatase [Chloroflexota bacterium]